MDIAQNVPDALTGDPHRLRQVLLNLIGNAVKFTDQGEVVARVALESESTETPQIRFSIIDTGIGIPKESQAQIFDAFTQADASATRKFGGTGLGLAISTRLVERMGGSLKVESEPGIGSTFSFIASFEKADTVAPTPARVADLSGISALVIDDNETNRKILEGQLQNWGMLPVSFAEGRSALTYLQQMRSQGRRWPVILLDYMMPEMDGLIVARKIREMQGGEEAALILLSSDIQSSERQQARALGIHASLLKPVPQSDLNNAIAESVGQRDFVQAESLLSPPEPVITRVFKLLLAEDNEINQVVARGLLERKGHTMTVVGDGAQAVEEVQKEQYDIVLMDLQMPDVDGFEATRRIRALERQDQASIPIIALTAHAMKGDRERCIAEGMSGYVVKPIHPDHLSRNGARQRIRIRK